MTTAKNDAFIFLLGWIEGEGWWGRGAEGRNEQIFGWLGGLIDGVQSTEDYPSIRMLLRGLSTSSSL